jgi:hypothetical protein
VPVFNVVLPGDDFIAAIAPALDHPACPAREAMLPHPHLSYYSQPTEFLFSHTV